MFLTTYRQRRFIFTVCTLLASVLVYEGEATEISVAAEERYHLRHEMYICKQCSQHQNVRAITLPLNTPYQIFNNLRGNIL